MPTPSEYSEDELTPRRRRPESILLSIALVCILLLAAVVLISLPYLHPDTPTDPEAMMHDQHIEQESEQKLDPILEEETVPQETIEPTIPPERSPFTPYDFQYNRDNYLICQAQDSYPGIDVSAFQGEIDWQKVAASGIRFAIVRLGFRGYGAAGNMVQDEYAVRNLNGAREAGLAVGAYFFSQATSIEEVDGEIAFMMKILGDFELDMPIILDWEIVSETGRTKNVDRRTLTDCLLHFCKTVEEMGHHPMIYFNWGQAARMIHLNELEDYPFWLALYQDRMTFPYRVEMWQYTCTGKVPGISGDVDIDLYIPDLRAK